MHIVSPTARRPLSGDAFFLLLLGAAAGFLNGLLGAAGGVILIFFLAKYSRAHQNALAPRDVYATALCVLLPLSLLSFLRYRAAGVLDPQTFFPFILPALVGGVGGALLLDRLPLWLVRRLFSVLLLCSGVLMLVRA